MQDPKEVRSKKGDKPLNIWMLDHYATPPDSPGSTRHYDLAGEFIKRGHQVSIFASGFNHRTRREERLRRKQNYRRQNIDGVRFVWIRTSPYYGGNDWRRVINMLTYSLRVVPFGLKFKERPDIILASSPHPFAGLAAYFLSKIKGARFVFEIRDLWPQVFVEIGDYSNKSPVVKVLRVLEKFLYQRASKIAVLMPKASDYITKLGIPSDKIVYIPNGVNPELFSNTDVKIPQQLDRIISALKSSDKILVAYAGAHGIHDALDTIIEAARLLQDKRVDKVHFLLIGDGTEKARIVEKAQSWGLNNITFFQFVPYNALPELLRAIDITSMCRRKTTLYRYGMSTLKLWDYMMCAKPVVWAIDSAIDPVAEANCGITVPPEEPHELARAIVELCELSEKERQDMGMRGYEYVMKYHSIPVLANRLLEVMQDVKLG